MELKLKVETEWKKVFQGKLYFETDKKKIVIDYFFAENEPSGSLKEGDEIDITFKVDDAELPIKGVFPEILDSVQDRAVCIFSLAFAIIWNQVFLILASAEEGGSYDIGKLSEDMIGDVDERTAKVLFGE